LGRGRGNHPFDPQKGERVLLVLRLSVCKEKMSKTALTTLISFRIEEQLTKSADLYALDKPFILMLFFFNKAYALCNLI
jgi:hypothetical protein